MGMIFFDLVGTLLYSSSFCEDFATVCVANGWMRSGRDVAHAREVVFSEEVGRAGCMESRGFYSSLLRGLGIGDVEIVSQLQDVFSDVQRYSLFDDVMPTLTILSQEGHRLGIVSNFEEWIEDVLMQLGIGPFFEVVVASSQVECAKPDCSIFEIALAQAGCGAVDATHIGDSWEHDVIPTRALGLRSVWLRRGNVPTADLAADQFATVISSLSELPPLIQKSREAR